MQIGIAILVVAIGIAGVFSWRAARTRQANDDLGRALTEYRAARYAQAATQFMEVAERWGSTPAGHLARIYAAQADLRADNVGNAVTVLQEARKGNGLPAYLQQEIVLTLGYASERSSDPAGAAARYQEAASMEGPYTATAIYAEARVRQQLGDNDAARKLQERLVTEFSTAPDAELVRGMLGQE
jgi:hypothetical protein